jgi:hypothetical protein
MFARGSRYRNLPESAPLDARGERVVGKELRFGARLSGQFLHTVNDRDRLDLLAFKYYGDPTRWWQISDANPEFPFPVDLLDRGPMVEELLALVDTDNAKRFDALVTAVNVLGQVAAKSNSFVAADIVAVFAAATVRPQIISAIGQRDFRFLHSYSWVPPGGGIAEAFTLEDLQLKTRWRRMLEDLCATPGVTGLQSNLAEATIHVLRNAAMIDRDAILSKLSKSGFAVSPLLSQQAERVGAKIIVPPNGPV